VFTADSVNVVEGFCIQVSETVTHCHRREALRPHWQGNPSNRQSVLKQSWQHGITVLSHSGTQSSFTAQMLFVE